MQVSHTFGPFYQKSSEILILGSMPSLKSREEGFYYMHPQNRFWKVLEVIYNEKIETSIEEKKKFLKKHKIALWDTIESCEIKGSSDASIKNVKVNDLNLILQDSKIKYIYTTGLKSYKLYNKYCYPKTKIKAIPLYSTSPANCAISFDKLIENYSQILKR